MATIWGGGYERKGRVGGVERRRWVEFFLEGDEDDVDRIDDGHDGADCGDDDGRDDDYKDEHCDDAGIEYSNNDGDGNGNDGDHDEDDGIGDRRGRGRINNQQQ